MPDATYTVHIIDTTTGEARDCPMSIDWGDDESAVFWWTEGNFGCDCNRGLVFHDYDIDPDCNVGPNRYRVTHATLADGRVVTIDGDLRTDPLSATSLQRSEQP